MYNKVSMVGANVMNSYNRLRLLSHTGPKKNAEMILEVAKQYKDDKVRYEEARDVIKLLTSLNYKTQQSKRPDDAYNNLMQKARGRLPISADVKPPRANARTIGKKRKALPRATVSVTCVLFGEPQESDMSATDNAIAMQILHY